MRLMSSLVRSAAPAALLILAAGCSADVAAPSLRTVVPPRPDRVTVASTDYSDGAGKSWRQPITTVGVSWNQVAQRCPRDGLTPCTGSIGAVDYTGWVWATSSQLVQLMSRWAPEILTSPTYSVNNVFAGIAIVSVFTPTQWFANTYSSSESVAGWTASLDSIGAPLGGGGGWSTPPHAGGLGIGSVANPDAVSSARGVFLWRADGSDGRVIVAANDSGAVAEPNGGTAVANVLANDLLAGATATVALVTLTQLTSSSSAVSLDVSDGSVDVAFGTPAGAASLTYKICETSNPSNCAQAAVAVAISGHLIDAVDDAGSAYTGGGAAVGDVRGNDQFGVPVSMALVSTSGAGISLDPADGSVDVAAGTAAGSYTLVYRLCEIASPTNCDTATVAISVVNYVIDAVNDQGAVPSATGGIAVANVLANDYLNFAAATLSRVTLSLVASSHPGVTLDLSDGSVDVAPQTASGMHVVTYSICERAMPTNCDQATATVAVAPQSIVVSRTSLTVKEGATGSFTVRLSQPPIAPVTVSVTFYAGTATLAPTPASITFTPSNWNTPVAVSVKPPKDSDKIDNAVTLNVSAAGIATVSVIVTVVDINRSVTNPTARIATPLNGQTVIGLVDFTGTGTDSNGIVVDGKFYVDGSRIYTDTNSSGSYRIPSRWDSSTVPNGWHTLELRVTDDSGADGRMTIRVLVNN